MRAGGLAERPLHPANHRVPVLGQHLLGRRTPRKAPSGTATIASPQPAEPVVMASAILEIQLDAPAVRREVRDPSIVELVVANGTQPLPAEPEHVVQPRRRRGEDLIVACPADPLPCRAVGRHVHGVAAEAPDRRSSCRRLRSALLHVKVPIRREIRVHDLHGDARGVDRATVVAPHSVRTGNHERCDAVRIPRRRAAGDDLVALPKPDRPALWQRRSPDGGGQITVRPGELAVVDRSCVVPPGRGRQAEIQPEAFLPKSATQLPLSSCRIVTGDRVSTPAHGRGGRPIDARGHHCVDHDRTPYLGRRRRGPPLVRPSGLRGAIRRS